MKEVLMMLLPDCPYCRQAEKMLSAVSAPNQEEGDNP